ncbi:hypothetical protein [Mycobacterium asiaticum]|uniref:Uncharacterized protein n=1 Tax=Mycobacterium asiaticum TaxID=1790 RepID=A0A1A3MU80_MYCAS|nr:hypothetical protein [Mycobacterium asiaticum]OBK12635.1 hypothetical protein A5636_11570 [Mycobacterium asiaticum]
MIIDIRKALLLLPVYVAGMVGTDLLMNSDGLQTRNDLPLWLIIGFTIMSVTVLGLVAWYLGQRSRGNVLVQTERVYMAFFIALFISGLVSDSLKALTNLIFHSMSIWILIPFYILSYPVSLAVTVIVTNRIATKSAQPQG